VTYRSQQLEKQSKTYCEACNKCGAGSVQNDDFCWSCLDSTVYATCQNNNNNNNYVMNAKNLKNYGTCQKVTNVYGTVEYDSAGVAIVYYSTMFCSAGNIKLGVFSDAYCVNLISGKTFEEVSGMTVSDDLMAPLYDTTIKSCSFTTNAQVQPWYADGMELQNNNNNNNGFGVTEYCNNMFLYSAKCDPASADTSVAKNCRFLNAMLMGQYDEAGDIYLQNPDFKSKSILHGATASQRTALGFLVPLSFGLSIYAFYLMGKAEENRMMTEMLNTNEEKMLA
jgi:hypothetical protein